MLVIVLPLINKWLIMTTLRNGVAVDKRINYRFNPERGYHCVITG